ncbi:MAG: toll/interleukin-1 receptor domain-containing protein [Clostridia bacterium]|nr:toll/interleukin-1 receptor domain-containing protein [Clostridia bacterium]
MNEKEYTYDAFISYRHADLDQYVAETLHKKLETFRLPLSAAKSKTGQKTRIKRVFRDKDELPIASNLADPIVTALKEAEFLIVICSPRTPESIWVEREIKTFISLHDRAHILAVLIEGEPVDSFPKILLEEEQSFKNEDGSVILQKIPVEPLAADVRGSSKREVGKNINRELLRLVSPLFHCSYDDLKQRHRERKIKRIITASLCTSAFFLCFGSYSTYQALRIKKQSEQIQKQSNEIQKQSDEIKEQYDKILVTNLNTLGDTALSQLESEDRMQSIETALSALPDGSADTSIPLLAHPQYALSEALYAYQNDSQLLADRVLKHNSNVSFMLFSPSKKRLLTVDDTNTLYIWEAANGKLVTSFPVITDSLLEEESFHFVSENEIIYTNNGKIVRYDFEKEKNVWEIDNEYNCYYAYSPDHQYLAVSDQVRLCLIDLKQGNVLFTKENETTSEYPLLAHNITFNQTSTKLAYSTTETSKDTIGEVAILDLTKKTITNTISVPYPRITSLLFTDQDTLAITSNAYVDYSNFTKELLFGNTGSSITLLYDTKNNSQLWSTYIDGGSAYHVLMEDPESKFLAVQGYDVLYSLSRDTGEIIGEISMSASITSCILFPKSTYGICMLRDGSAVSIDLDGAYSYKTLFQSDSNNLKDMQKGEGGLYVLPFLSNRITRYAYLKNDKMEQFAETDCSYELVINKDSSLVISNAMNNEHTISVFDTATRKPLFTKNLENIFYHYFFAGENDEYIGIVYNDTIDILNAKTGDLIKTINCGTNRAVIKIAKNIKTNHLFTISEYEVAEYDLNTLEQINLYSFEEPFELISEMSMATNGVDIVVADERNSTGLDFYQLGNNEPQRHLELNANYVDNLFYNDEGTELFVVYKNGSTEIYQTSDFALLGSYLDLNTIVNEYHSLPNGNGNYILSNKYEGFLCSPNNEVLAHFPYMNGIDVNNNQIFAADTQNLYTIPIYNLDMLIEEAKRQLQQ